MTGTNVTYVGRKPRGIHVDETVTPNQKCEGCGEYAVDYTKYTVFMGGLRVPFAEGHCTKCDDSYFAFPLKYCAECDTYEEDVRDAICRGCKDGNHEH